MALNKTTCEALRLYKLAADQGDAETQYNLALMYRRREGVRKTTKKASDY